MSLLTTLYLLLSGVILYFLVQPFWMTLVSRFVRPTPTPPEEGIPPSGGVGGNTDFGCIITAYRNCDIAEGLVKSLLAQTHDNYHVYLVADNCDVSNWTLEDPRFTLLHPQPALNLKAKSIIYADQRFVRPHDHTVIFDADNLAHPRFLEELNAYVNVGFRAVQGQRTAKNLDTLYACADATGEFYKNYIERLVPPLLGSSSVISGSGMSVETELYRSYLYGPEIQEGQHKWKKMLQEDKILQNHLLDRDERIVYAWDAVVYDEKVTTGQAVETQRSRWLYSYFQNLPNSSRILRKGLTRFSWNQLIFGLVTIAPPLFIMLGIALALIVPGIWLAPWMSAALVAGLAIFSLNLLWTLKLSEAPKPIWTTLWSLPLFVWNQVTALPKMLNPNRNFKHTEHKHVVQVEEVEEF